MAVDALVESITTYCSRPIWAHLYATPFAVLYASWFYIWSSAYGYEEYYELGLIGAAIIGLLQALVILFSHWFVGVKCALSCVYEKDPHKATLVKVVPTPNNGWAELVPLRRTRVIGPLFLQFISMAYIHVQRAGCTKVWFEFQKIHYTLDPETNTFSTVVFDSHRPMKYYQQSRGVESDEQLEETKYLYG
ncbi:unnamed protein product, partial [Cylicostephanus goldi]